VDRENTITGVLRFMTEFSPRRLVGRYRRNPDLYGIPWYVQGRRKDVFQRGPIVDFPWVAKKIFVGGKSGKFHANHSKLRKQPFLLKI